MDKEYTIKTRKQPDGSRKTVGNVKPGKYGPQMGLRVTEEFRTMVNGTEVGGWINLDLYPKDDQYPAAGGSGSAPQNPVDTDNIPF